MTSSTTSSTTTSMTSAANARRTNRFAVWFGFWGGSVAWVAHLLGASVIAEWGYLSGLHHRTWQGLTAVAWAILVLSAAMVLLAAAATWIACRIRGTPRHVAAPEADDTTTFLARAGFIASGTFLFIIVAQSVPVFFFLRGDD